MPSETTSENHGPPPQNLSRENREKNPAAAGNYSGDTTRRSKIMGNATAISPGTPFILLVDDEPKNLQVAGALLRSAGFDIGLVSSGADALNLISSEPPDLIL